MILFLLGELAALVGRAFLFEMFTTPFFFVEPGAEEEIDTDFFVLEKKSNPPIPFASRRVLSLSLVDSGRRGPRDDDIAPALDNEDGVNADVESIICQRYTDATPNSFNLIESMMLLRCAVRSPLNITGEEKPVVCGSSGRKTVGYVHVVE